MEILKFFSPTCGPCKVMGKNLEEVSKLTGIEVQEIDISDENNMPLINKWKVRRIPTTIVIDNNDVVHEFKGIVPASKIMDELND